ncbi:MAG: hypothetical protein ACFCD0_21930 [Gemmataceae bacterium]
MGSSILDRVSYGQPNAHGSANIIGEGHWIGIDFSDTSGAPEMIVITSSGITRCVPVKANGVDYQFNFLTNNNVPAPRVDGNRVIIGE